MTSSHFYQTYTIVNKTFTHLQLARVMVNYNSY